MVPTPELNEILVRFEIDVLAMAILMFGLWYRRHGDRLRFWDAESAAGTDEGAIGVETKSRFGRGIADRILRARGLHPVGACSKYCVGLAALGIVPSFNKFRPAFQRLLPHLSDGTGIGPGADLSRVRPKAAA